MINNDARLGLWHEPSIRRYYGEYAAHAHDYVQVMFALDGRLELEIAGKAAFSDASCGLIVPAGVAHAFCAERSVRMFVLDVQAHSRTVRPRSFAVTPALKRQFAGGDSQIDVAAFLDAPRIVKRRAMDISSLKHEIVGTLHESWPTARMARFFCLSTQRFHARFLELTGQTPQSYVRMLRLDCAMERVRHGHSLEAVAQEVGYCSASALAFALKRDRKVGARSLR